MLEKNIDCALVGHNYLTYMLGLGLLNRGKKVLLLDDDRFNYGDFFTNSLSEIDLQIIKKIGEKNSWAPFANIMDYVEGETHFFFLKKKQVYLGLDPYSNFMELARKFDSFFLPADHVFDEIINRENLNESFKKFCLDFAEGIVSGEAKFKFFSPFDQTIHSSLHHAFKTFFKTFHHKSELSDSLRIELNSFTYLLRGFFQHRFSISGSESELLHVFMSLLSPFYRLDHDRLNRDLKILFTSQGGHFKGLNLGDLKLQSGVVKSIELTSFEGLITPKKIVFVGGHPYGMPVTLKGPQNVYNCLKVNIRTNEIPELLIGKKIVSSSPMKISTDRPMFEAIFNKESIVLNWVFFRPKGTKISFVKDKVMDEFKRELKYLYPEFKIEFLDFEMNFTHDIFIEDKNFKAHEKRDIPWKNKISKMILSINPISSMRLKNVHYIGPFNDGFLGTLSGLLEIKQWQERL